ncbi:MAG: hypothetical protein DRP14_01550 [Candidatus Aenigmatarchaeota archaeon]|nr:MAG: hypothetical protein DRP14_01550 [Candidatus Aenigmarchaeota archaeon]
MVSINLTFLGTGTAIPTLKRKHSSIHLYYQGKNGYSILFDCGEGTQTQLLKARINFMSIDHIFITHWHADHFIGLFGLLVSMGFEKRERELKIFAPKGDKIGPGLLKFYKLPFPVKFFDSYKNGVICEEEEFLVEAMPVKHTIETVAYKFQEKDRLKLDKKKIKKLSLTWQECREIKEKRKIKKNGKLIKLEDVSYKIEGKKIVYAVDTVYLKKMEKFCKDSILIHECTYFSKEDIKHKMHSCLQDVLKFRKVAKKIYLTHIGRQYQSQSELEEKVKRYKNVFVAKDLMKVKI